MLSPETTDTAAKLAKLSFLDLHYHANPDLYIRRLGAIEAGAEYRAQGGGVLLYSHLGSTVDSALAGHAAGSLVLGSVILNPYFGGLNLRGLAVEAAKYSRFSPFPLLVSFPTVRPSGHVSRLQRDWISPDLASLPALREDNEVSAGSSLTERAKEVFRWAKDHPVRLASGHASKQQVLLMLELAYKTGISDFLVTQPANPMTGFAAHELETLVRDFPFAWIEQNALTFLLGYQDWEDFSRVLRANPRVIYASDLGQASQPPLCEWREQSRAWFHRMGLSPERIRRICLSHPLQFLPPSTAVQADNSQKGA